MEELIRYRRNGRNEVAGFLVPSNGRALVADLSGIARGEIRDGIFYARGGTIPLGHEMPTTERLAEYLLRV